MGLSTIRSLAEELGLKYDQVRHVLRRGYVPVERPTRRKYYLNPTQVRAIKVYFGFDGREPSDAGRPASNYEGGNAVLRNTGRAMHAVRQQDLPMSGMADGVRPTRRAIMTTRSELMPTAAILCAPGSAAGGPDNVLRHRGSTEILGDRANAA